MSAAVTASAATGTDGLTSLPVRRPPVRAPRWWRDAVGAVTWLTMLVVVALWISGGGIQAMGTPAGALTSLGRLTGLVAADLLLVQVLLMARIPVVERVYGQDDLARRHRLVGFASFHLMLAHLVLVVIGYALTFRTDVFGEFWGLVVDAPGMLLALAGTLLLVMVVVLSVRAARRRLRYESWHLLHLYAYLGVGLAIPHQLWTGQDFLADPIATVYWWTLWAAAAGCLLVFRVGLPVYRSLVHDLRVSAVVHESPDVVSVWMQGRRLDRLPVAAGQFLTWRFLSGPGWTRGHPYSLSAAPTGDTLRITVKDLGDGSRALAAVKPGTRVLVEGPYGRLTAGVRTRRKVTLMAAGIGISPLRALLEDLAQAPGDVTLLYRARSTADLVLRHELDALAQRTGARVFYLVGPRLPGRPTWLPASAAGLSEVDGLRRLVPDIADHDVYLCGADAWMEAARRAVAAAGVPTAHIHQERFAW
ncbi:ferredoxin reductase family protein [Propionicicella superfundia]|uniref:ferredoxin reductase family protein n=1 Tax=Propionicicella superfundia TaxID=348582 RepID=UPI00055B6A11|nr:ferredoxin reductase family protein [Propionicicella superfundia]